MLHRSASLQKFISRRCFGKTPKPKSQLQSKQTAFLSSKCSSIGGIERPHFFYGRTRLISFARVPNFHYGRSYSVEIDGEVDLINLKFAEAREEIESAMESKETVYFNEEAECARAAVGEVLEMYEGLLGKLPESQKAALHRAMGLKIEQLKAELQQLDE